MLFRKGVLQKRSKFTEDHPCRSVNSIKLHSKNSSINLHFSGMSTSLDGIKFKFITRVLTSVMLVIICCDCF